MMRSYERLTIEQFGRHLITTGDLDPVYIALHNMQMEEGQRNRWLLAYWCYYHTGFASFMSEKEGDDYWRWMMTAAENADGAGPKILGIADSERWPRGGERRHFRGQQAMKATYELRERYGQAPEDMVRFCAEKKGSSLLFTEVNQKVQEHRGFGDWIGFKVADMLDRLGIVPVNFSEGEIFMYKDPLKSALMVWRDAQGLPDNAVPKDQNAAVHSVVEYLKKEFSDLLAPPLGDRLVDIQEVETVLCKYKSHLNGHYPLNNDTLEIRHGLAAWSSVETAKKFLEAMPT